MTRHYRAGLQIVTSLRDWSLVNLSIFAHLFLVMM